MKYLAAILALTLSGCASQTFYRTGQGEKGAVAVKAFQNYGDLVGDIEYDTASGHLSVSQPTAPVPVQLEYIINKKGELVGINQTPMLAGIYNSRVNDSVFGGISKVIRAVSNLAGTALSGMMGIAAVQGAAQASVAASNAAVAQSGQAARVSLGQQATTVKLAEIAAKPIP